MNKSDLSGLYVGETITLDVAPGYTARVKCEYDDEDSGPPWENCDGHGVVTDWMSKENKRAGYRVLSEDHGSYRYYDFAASCKRALAEHWNAPPYGQGTAKQRAERAAEADYEFLRAWCADDWCYVGVIVKLFHNGAKAAEDSCWGIETWKDYHQEHAVDMVNELLCQHAEELRERDYWAARDVATI